MATSKTHKTIDEYIKDHTEATQKRLIELRQCILKAAPNAVEMFNYNIPAFALKEGGNREEQVMMAGYKKHIGFYPHPTVIEHFAEDLKDYKQGKGSVQFPVESPLPKDLIVRMVKYRVKLLAQR
jgi:uncharacterized protein YdhG (YjbR/CyaY superfamily)